MQPDYSKMAQAPKTQGEGFKDLTPEELAMGKEKLSLDAADYEAMEMPSGDDPESIKKRVVLFFERLGLMEGLSQEGLLELQQKIDDFVQAVVAQDKQKVLNHPITKIMNKVVEETRAQTEGPQAAPQQPAAPTDFAGMVKPPMGGGMSGR
jgi:hypothetical protein